ncbi:MAG TPA: carbohydrate-binding family V/XII [Woeseiaceae bacterium]|nr:carbohydrate-binding family V/XII [Woeseiaceae bacterium]
MNSTVSQLGIGHVRAATIRLSMLALLLACSAAAQAIDWPQEITADEGTIVVYQPQPERLVGNVLSARAAMAIELKDNSEPIFGVFWFDSTIDTDKEGGTVTIRDIRLTNVRWPDSTDANEQRFTAIVEAAVPATGFEVSLETLSASLESAELEKKSLEELKNDPPEIVFREELAVLLPYDGEPRYADVENSDYERVLNTPMAVVRKKRSNDHYLYGGKFWYQAKDPMGPWTATDAPPADLAKMLQEVKAEEGQPDSPPAIVTANKPTELIVTQGTPSWKLVAGEQLLYVQNTESPWLREIATGNMYLLLSGRWYRAKSTYGPWVFVRADELPASFKDIPPASDIGGLRVSIAGTEEAEDALLDAQIPQTAAIKRSEAKLTVEYDGEPKFEMISGTDVSYAVNTGAQVLQIGTLYYAVDNGVWFSSASATGPWAVADSIPEDEIQKIPPSSPVYNTTHVHIYESTPEVVYVGYTPGYMWSFPYYGVPVYGTGWYYPPYYGHYYYPRPPTWGFNVGYNPWTGWSFGLSWTNGFFTVGIGWGGGYGGMYPPYGCCGGFYGGGYRGPVFINTGDINIGNNVNVGNRDRVSHNMDQAGTRDLDKSRNNLYDRSENRARNADTATAQRQFKEARPAAERPNDVFADRDGNVARRTGDEWQTRQNGQWQQDSMSRDQLSPGAADRMQAPTSGNYDRSGLNRDSAARQRGTTRQAARPQTMRRPAGRRR